MITCLAIEKADAICFAKMCRDYDLVLMAKLKPGPQFADTCKASIPMVNPTEQNILQAVQNHKCFI